MVAKRVISIGQEAFVLSPDGEVVRTMIAKLEKEGYRFLNGDDERRRHWFSFEGAISAASERIIARQVALRKQLRALALKRRALEEQNYRDGVVSAPYRVVDLRDTVSHNLTHLRPSRNLKKVHVPETYLRPGHVVYVAITPATRSEFETYRPYKHFVLETEVASVCFSPDGQVYYTFSTPFIVREFFLSRRGAAAKNFSEPGTKDLVPFVSSKQEKEEIAKIPDDCPF